jgi:hypothetical protein
VGALAIVPAAIAIRLTSAALPRSHRRAGAGLMPRPRPA